MAPRCRRAAGQFSRRLYCDQVLLCKHKPNACAVGALNGDVARMGGEVDRPVADSDRAVADRFEKSLDEAPQ
jgi:hypothetical protein